MNFIKFINRKQLVADKEILKSKLFHYKNIKKNDIISVGYHEYDKEETKLEVYKGICLKLKGGNLNTKIILFSKLEKNKVILNFFFYNPFLFDLKKH